LIGSKIKLIAFSGIDGAGKSTQIEMIIKRLKSEGYSPKYLWSRGGYYGPINTIKTNIRRIFGEKVIPIGRDSKARTKAFSNKYIRNIWLHFAIFDLIMIYCMYIPLLNLFGRTVIADRYLFDTKIDFSLNFPEIKVINWSIWRLLEKLAPTPARHYLLLIPIAESMRRSKLKNEPFPDSKIVLQRRLKYYKDFGKLNEIVVVDCLKSVESVQYEILEQIYVKPERSG
jgi:thymidylate kinase